MPGRRQQNRIFAITLAIMLAWVLGAVLIGADAFMILAPATAIAAVGLNIADRKQRQSR